MTTAAQVLDRDAAFAAAQPFRAPLQLLTGFFFAFRFAITYLAFQAEPRAGSIVNLACSALLLCAAALYRLGDDSFSARLLLANRTLRWLLLYLAVSGISLLWTAADSILDAGALWCGMGMEVAMALLLVRPPRAAADADALCKGFAAGMLAVGAIAWAGPTLPDLRIGDYDFLHPNMVGMYCALAFFLAQHLAFRQRAWRWACLGLGMTLLRTISKTSIVAFLVAETFYLLRESQLSSRAKVQISVAAGVVIAAFATLLESYFEIYATAGSGTQVETLTGRTAIWTTAFFMAIERPWIGHGFYSFRALIPAFGDFEPWHAHNELLQEFFEYGALGVVVTAGLYLALARSARRVAAAAMDGPGRSYARVVQVVVLFALVHGLTESVNFGLTIPLWLFAAFAIALEQPQAEVHER